MNIISWHSGETEVVVIGAGAAGIGAAAALQAAQVPFVLVEAEDRIGGRAHTVTIEGFPVDFGCGWLHSADKNPWTAIAQNLGFTVDRTRPHWERQSCNQGISAEEQKAFRAASAAFYKRLDDYRGEDRPAAAFLEPGNPWNPLLNSISGYYNAAPLAEVSVLDFNAYEDTEVNWRVTEGYGALIAAFATSVPVALSCAVIGINHQGRRLQVETVRGRVTARKVIITVPSAVLASGAIGFTPALPDKIESAANLPLGVVNKAFFHCDAALPTDGHFFGDMHSANTGSYHLRPFGRPLIEAYYANALACDLAREGTEATLAFGMNELVKLLGSDTRKSVRPLTASHWNTDPHILGAYSHAKVGHSDARKHLAEPIDDRLFFAGEATSPHAFSTAHGAYLSGVKAAQEAVLV